MFANGFSEVYSSSSDSELMLTWHSSWCIRLNGCTSSATQYFQQRKKQRKERKIRKTRYDSLFSLVLQPAGQKDKCFVMPSPRLSSPAVQTPNMKLHYSIINIVADNDVANGPGDMCCNSPHIQLPYSHPIHLVCVSSDFFLFKFRE